MDFSLIAKPSCLERKPLIGRPSLGWKSEPSGARRKLSSTRAMPRKAKSGRSEASVTEQQGATMDILVHDAFAVSAKKIAKKAKSWRRNRGMREFSAVSWDDEVKQAEKHL